MYDISIARLYSITLRNCNYVTIWSIFVLYEKKMENKKNMGIFCLEMGKNIIFGIGNGAEIPQIG